METEILLRGRLMKVNREKRTAELHGWGDSQVPLQFEDNLSETMQRLATCFVRVKGAGNAEATDQRGPLAIREISVEWPNIDEFYALEPKIFDPEKATRFSQRNYDDQADMEEFIRIIHGGHDS